ncbi:MAG: mannosyltransferase, partial [Lentimicrobium sp.]|nr:mannosyltransferase [Lentimicrobium sp.]
MKNRTFAIPFNNVNQQEATIELNNNIFPAIAPAIRHHISNHEPSPNLAEILFVTSYPPRECGIATYSQDLIKAILSKFSKSLSIKVCALESGDATYKYPDEVKYTLKTSQVASYEKLANEINKDEAIKLVFIQHEFGFYRFQEQAFLQFLYNLSKPIAIVFHTVLPHPGEQLKLKVRNIAAVCESIVVMTHTSANILINEYGVSGR